MTRRNFTSKERRQFNFETGFTIVELMIATTVLSVLLLLVTLIMSNIGNLYYKDVNQSRIQDDARNITNQVSQDLEISDGFTGYHISRPFLGRTQAYCISNVRFTFVIGKQLGSATPHVLWQDVNPNPAGKTCKPATGFPNPSGSGTELMAPSSRLITFSITGTSPYAISLGMAYGDNDLLCSPMHPTTCTTSATMNNRYFTDGDLLCKGRTGESFCATAYLSTSVVQRLTQGN